MVTIADVAKAAGVSRSTVSYALSGKRSISDEVKDRVYQAIEELDYFPSALGRTLRTSETNTIALLAPMLGNVAPDIGLRFINGVVEAARKEGKDVLLVTGRESLHSVNRLARSNQVDGFIVLDVEENDPRIEPLSTSRVPAVFIGMPPNVTDTDRVDMQWEAAGRILIEKAADAGHEQVGLLTGPEEGYEMGLTYATKFIRGIREAADERGIELYVAPASNDYLSTASTTMNLFTDHPAITAIVVQHEVATGPLYAVATARGLQVPDDLSILAIVVDGTQSLAPPVSGVINPVDGMTKTAVNLLVERLADPATPARTVLFNPTFQNSGTLAPPPH